MEVLNPTIYGWKKTRKKCAPIGYMNRYLVGGFNLFEKYQSKWESSPRIGVHVKNI